jgi:hypothetical protein
MFPRSITSTTTLLEGVQVTSFKIKDQALPSVVVSVFKLKLSRDVRNNYARELFAAGWTLTAIGEAANLTRERIRQILKEPSFKVSGFPVPQPPRKPAAEKATYLEPEPELLTRLLELQPLAQQVRSNGSAFRKEAEEYTRLLAKAHLEEGVTLYRLAMRLGVTHGALRFRLVRYGYMRTTGKSKSYRPVDTNNRAV